MTDATIIQGLISVLIMLLGFFGVMINKKLDKVQADVNGMAINHGQRLTKLETRDEIIKGQLMHNEST